MESEIFKKIFSDIANTSVFVDNNFNVYKAIQSQYSKEIFFVQVELNMPNNIPNIAYISLLISRSEPQFTEVDENVQDELAKSIINKLNLKKLKISNIITEEIAIYTVRNIFQKPSPKGENIINIFYRADELVASVIREYIVYQTADMNYNVALFKFNIAKNAFKNNYIKLLSFEERIRRWTYVTKYYIQIYNLISLNINTIHQIIGGKEEEKQKEKEEEEEDIRLKKLKQHI